MSIKILSLMPLMKNQLLEAGEGPALCSHSALYLTFLAQACAVITNFYVSLSQETMSLLRTSDSPYVVFDT